ncbi:hypothetical protein ACJ41O_012695 [Fusarium nematophilum]
MVPPPPYKPTQTSISRSRTGPDEIASLADAMLRASITSASTSSASTTSSASITSSTSTVLPPYPKSSSRSSITKSSLSSSNSSASRRSRDLTPSSDPPPGVRSPPDSATTSRTRERLRQKERELEDLRRAMEGERAMADRLKREADVKIPTDADTKLRFLDLKREANDAAAREPARSTEGMFKKACSTDLLFLIDTTGSMWSYIKSAKDQVKSIMDDIKKTFLNEADVRIAVVGYKDHNDKPNIEFLDFTSSVETVREFLNKLSATGGDDCPEDVLGGIRQAINATWYHQTRCIIHIADAPPHGRIFHDLSDSSDHYPEPGTEPHRLTYQPLFKKMVGLSINYVLLRIHNVTDRMAYTFLKEYAAASADCKLLRSNKYYTEATEEATALRSGLRGGDMSRSNMTHALLFEEAELGTSYSALRHLVVRSVTNSASRTAVRMSMARSTTATTGGIRSHKTAGLASIEEDDSASMADTPLEKIMLKDTSPEWNMPGWLNETIVMQGFCPDVVVHSEGTLNDMMADDDNIKLSAMELTIHKRSQPFSQGALRLAAYARAAVSTNRYVVKWSKKDGKKLAHLAEDMRCQALCKAFALEFNALSNGKHTIDFIVTTCLQRKGSSSSSADCLSLEPWIPGTYVKYNSNNSYVLNDPDNEFNKAAQAFSHYTYERSWGRFLVCDLQGVGHTLTDPAICTLDKERFKLADTNIGKEGFKFFFCTHECNEICRKLKLKSNREGLEGLEGSQEFREWWPAMDNTVCCSNKLCGKILRSSRAKKSKEFPGCNWCDMCWPQLESSKVSWLCVAPGPHHEFTVSRFFYESAGRVTPRKCAEHRDPEPTVSRTATVGGSFWSKLNNATKKKTISGKAW